MLDLWNFGCSGKQQKRRQHMRWLIGAEATGNTINTNKNATQKAREMNQHDTWHESTLSGNMIARESTCQNKSVCALIKT